MGYKEGVNREGPHGSKVESSFCAHFDPAEWEGNGRYKKVLDMARRNASYDEVRESQPDVTEDLYEVYRKIVTGTTTNLGKYGNKSVVSVAAQRRRYMLQLHIAGVDIKEIAKITGAAVSTVRKALF